MKFGLKGRDLGSDLKEVRFAQRNNGNKTLYDALAIPTGRRIQTSACWRFYSVFLWVLSLFRGLKICPVRNLSKIGRDCFWVHYRPLRLFHARQKTPVLERVFHFDFMIRKI